jgi:nitrogen fixation protein NifU and related proteins
MYSPQLLAQFENPRFVGELADADVSVQQENPACGDILRLTLKWHAGHIAQARFRAKGCVAAIASGSQLCEMLEGKSTEQLRKLRREEIVVALGGLPEASTHASHLVFDVLQAALRKLNAQGPSNKS